jgi:hypothetical protein
LETIVLLTYDILHIYGPPLSDGKQDETKVASQNQKDSSKSSRAADQFVSKGCEHGCVGSVDAAKMGGEWSSSTASSLDCDFYESESDEEDEADGSEDGEADLLHDEGLAELLVSECNGFGEREVCEDDAPGQEDEGADFLSATPASAASAMGVEKTQGERAVEILRQVVKREEQKGSRTHETSKALRSSRALLLDSLRENIKGGTLGESAMFGVNYLWVHSCLCMCVCVDTCVCVCGRGA